LIAERDHLREVNAALLGACKQALAMMDSMDETDARCTTGYGYVEEAMFAAIKLAEKD
jgi:hypothetical protein